jgi:peptidoglycan/xylan/chitin deacetylase (PgdA/CDA1 family)
MPLVLMYHSVEPYDADPYQITVRPRRFQEQMSWLQRRGLRGTSMRHLLAARRADRREALVGLTFDDGYTDFVTHVLPVLGRCGFTATVFVVAGAIGTDNSWDPQGPRKTVMSGADVRRAAAAGMEIGSHSLNHRRLPEADDLTLSDEIRRSRALLADLIGEEIEGFCYPYGAVGQREIAAVRGAGYDYACAVGVSALSGRHALPRTYIGDRDSSPRLFAKSAYHRLTRRAGVR